MAKKKLTLSVDDALLRKAKIELAGREKSVSEAVEELFKSMDDYWIEDLARKLGIKLGYVSPEEMKRRRGKKKAGLDSVQVLKELREEHEKALLGH